MDVLKGHRGPRRLQRMVGGGPAGIVTSLLVALLGMARVYVVLGREWLLPSWFAYVHPTRETPLHAAAWTGVTAGAAHTDT